MVGIYKYAANGLYILEYQLVCLITVFMGTSMVLMLPILHLLYIRIHYFRYQWLALSCQATKLCENGT